MPPPSSSTVSYWTSLADAADAGALYLHPDAARQCFEACINYIAKLNQHQSTAKHLTRVDGLGSFPSGIELAERFSKKAAGGDNNLVDVLQSHIDVVTQMQVVFQKLMAATADTDHANAAALRSEGPS